MAEEQAQIPPVQLVEELTRREQQLKQMRQAYIELQQRQLANDGNLQRIMKNITHLPTFTGTGEVTTNTFMSSVDYLLSTIRDEQTRRKTTRAVYYRVIQGEAKNVIINIPQPDDWNQIKKALKLRYKRDTEPHEIYRKICNLRINSMLTSILLIWTHPSYGLLTTTELTEQTGFVDIHLRTQDIVNLSYSDNHKGPFIVYLDKKKTKKESARTPINAIRVRKLIQEHKVEDVIDIVKIGYGRCKITFKNGNAANNFSELINDQYEARIFVNFVSKIEMMFDVPTDISEGELLEGISSPIKIIRIMRVMRTNDGIKYPTRRV
uniref:Uncharacterized protein n=1 Tax=Ceratitis capitata TaxID=7213 RepID=W8B1H4_CERCA